MTLEVRDLHFDYSTKKVLNGLSFKLEKGSFTCILGSNGAGKSTLFRCILQFLQNYHGDILLDDKNLRSLSDEKRASQMAYIPQSHYSVFNYTVFDVVLMATQVDGFFSTPGQKQKESAQWALEKIGTQHLAYRGYSEISGGERQMILIARALAQGAPVLIMDEPTSSLDYGNQIRVMELIRRLSEDGYTIVQSTHNPDLALQFAHRILTLEEGLISADGPPGKVLTGELLSRLYRFPIEVLPLENQKGWTCIPRFFSVNI